MKYLFSAAALMFYVVAFVIAMLVMIYGWGLTPVSWWWIIGGTLVAAVFQVVGTALGKAGA